MTRQTPLRRALAVVCASLLGWSTMLATSAFGTCDEELPRLFARIDRAADLDLVLQRAGASLRSWRLESHRVAELTTVDCTLKVKKVRDVLGKDDAVRWVEDHHDVAGEPAYVHAWPHGLPVASLEQEMTIDAALAERLGLGDAHERATGSGIVVAILDTGVDTSHPALASRVVSGFDYVDGDVSPVEETNGIDDDGDGRIDEAHGHGTHVAGVVLEIAPDARIMPMRVLDADGVGDAIGVALAIDDAVAAGADVINTSFGSFTKSKMIERAVKRAMKAGVIVVSAAGNAGTDDKQYPAAQGGVIGVGASHEAAIASFSGRGGWVDVVAPGTGIVSALPGGGYGVWNGTSMAAPIVAGQAALLREVAPELSGKDLRKIIRKTSRKAEGSIKGSIIALEAAVDEAAAKG